MRAIKKAERAGKPITFNSISAYMPAETRNYVPKLQAVKNIIAHADQYGVKLPAVENQPYFVTIGKTRDIDVKVAAKLAEINGACDSILKTAVKTYPDTEVMTFDQQVREAQSYMADPASPVSLLASLASARGIELADLAARVMAKHQVFSALSGAVIGQRQALEDQLDACTSLEEVNALAVNIVMPS